MKKEYLREARLNWITDEIKRLKIEFPNADISSKTGYAEGIVSMYLNGKRALSENFLIKFCEVYKLDYEKAKTGILDRVDEIEASINGISLSEPKQVIPLGKHVHSKLTPEEYAAAHMDWLGLPMYNTPVTASFVASYRDEGVYKPQYYLHDPRFRDCDFGAIITGDSMHAEIRHGDFVACKEITDWKFVVYGDIYYVVSTNGLETCKYLNADPHNPGNFLLVPRNESISPSPIPKEMILRLYRVRGIVRGY